MDWLFEHDTALKILAVLVAIAVWVQVNESASPHDRTLRNVPVTWTPPKGSGRFEVTIRPATVSIVIKGSLKAVQGNAAAWVNLTAITRAGTFNRPVVAAAPPNTSVMNVQPRTVTVTVVKEISRTFAVKLEGTGSVASGYGVVTMALQHHQAVVRGVSSAVKKVAAIVARVPLSGQSGTFSTGVTLVAVDAAGAPVKGVTVSPPSRQVTVTVSPAKTVPVTVKYSGKPAAGYTVGTISVSPLDVTVFGTQAALAKISAIYTTPVNINGATGPVSATPSLALPSGVTSTSPSTVTVTINVQ